MDVAAERNASGKASKKIYLVNRDFQLKYTWAAVVVGLTSTILSATLVIYPLFEFEILRIPRFLPTPILVAMVAAAVLNIAVIAAMGIFVTHRIAGPMYSIVRHLRRLAAGRWAVPMRLRDEDELKFVVRNINDLVESLSHIASQDKKLVNGLIQDIQAGNTQAALESAEALRNRLDDRLETAGVEA